MSSGDKRAEIYTYAAQDPVYAMNWSVSGLPVGLVPRQWACSPRLCTQCASLSPRKLARGGLCDVKHGCLTAGRVTGANRSHLKCEGAVIALLPPHD